jgi:hypothetical protein
MAPIDRGTASCHPFRLRCHRSCPASFPLLHNTQCCSRCICRHPARENDHSTSRRLLNDVAEQVEVVGLGITEHLPWDAIAIREMPSSAPLDRERLSVRNLELSRATAFHQSRRRTLHDSPAGPIAPVGSVAPTSDIRAGHSERRDRGSVRQVAHNRSFPLRVHGFPRSLPG